MEMWEGFSHDMLPMNLDLIFVKFFSFFAEAAMSRKEPEF